MSFIKKIKDILFDEEEVTEAINIQEDIRKEEPKSIKIENLNEEVKPEVKLEQKREVKYNFDDEVLEPKSERSTFKVDNSFKFPEFDEEEFANSMPPQRSNVLELERKKTVEKRTDYGRYERVEKTEIIDRKKFKPSPIISPVYGVLNQDYRAEDIVDRKDVESNKVDIDVVRKKAFETSKTFETPKIIDVVEEELIDDPVVTFFEEKETISNVVDNFDNTKTIDELLDSEDKVELEDEIQLPKDNNLDAIEEELEKLDSKQKDISDELDKTLDTDLYDLIDSMYDDGEGDN